MRLLFWLTVLGLAIGSLVLADRAECEDCKDHRLCHAVNQCMGGCQCIPMPGRNVGQCQ